MAGSVALWSGEPERTQIATANGASGIATPARSASTERRYGELSWCCPLKQVVKGDMLPGFQGPGIIRMLKVHDRFLCTLSCNCRLPCKSGCGMGWTTIFTRSHNEHDRFATESGRTPSAGCPPAARSAVTVMTAGAG